MSDDRRARKWEWAIAPQSEKHVLIITSESPRLVVSKWRTDEALDMGFGNRIWLRSRFRLSSQKKWKELVSPKFRNRNNAKMRLSSKIPSSVLQTTINFIPFRHGTYALEQAKICKNFGLLISFCHLSSFDSTRLLTSFFKIIPVLFKVALVTRAPLVVGVLVACCPNSTPHSERWEIVFDSEDWRRVRFQKTVLRRDLPCVRTLLRQRLSLSAAGRRGGVTRRHGRALLKLTESFISRCYTPSTVVVMTSVSASAPILITFLIFPVSVVFDRPARFPSSRMHRRPRRRWWWLLSTIPASLF